MVREVRRQFAARALCHRQLVRASGQDQVRSSMGGQWTGRATSGDAVRRRRVMAGSE